MDIYSIWAKSTNKSLDKAKELINEIAEKEDSKPFNPHVTLVTNMYFLYRKLKKHLRKSTRKKL